MSHNTLVGSVLNLSFFSLDPPSSNCQVENSTQERMRSFLVELCWEVNDDLTAGGGSEAADVGDPGQDRWVAGDGLDDRGHNRQLVEAEL